MLMMNRGVFCWLPKWSGEDEFARGGGYGCFGVGGCVERICNSWLDGNKKASTYGWVCLLGDFCMWVKGCIKEGGDELVSLVEVVMMVWCNVKVKKKGGVVWG